MDPVKIFYDTEFLEDGRTIDLISIGMVADDGRELYLVNQGIEDDPLHERICRDRWLMGNVVPHLPLREKDPITQPQAQYAGRFWIDHGDNRIVSIRFIRNAVRDFVLSTPQPELWAWYGAYDHVVLAQLFGRMIHLPQGFPMWTHEMQQELDRAGIDAPEQSGDLHNALADAKHLATLDRLVKAAGSETGDGDGC
jgi:hypothetical protein